MVVDVDVRWAGEPDIVLGLSGIPGAALGLSTVHVAFELRLILSPIIGAWAPCCPTAAEWARTYVCGGGPVCSCRWLLCLWGGHHPPLAWVCAPMPMDAATFLPACLLTCLRARPPPLPSPPPAEELPFLTGISFSLVRRPYFDFDVR